MTSERFRHNLYVVAIVMVWIYLMWLLAGCKTTYEVRKDMPDGSSVSVVVESYREFEQPQVHYSRTADTVTFDFGAESATTGHSPIEESVAGVIAAGGSIGANLAGAPSAAPHDD
jgi:hypothetical protein